jgi:hypothetical protein
MTELANMFLSVNNSDFPELCLANCAVFVVVMRRIIWHFEVLDNKTPSEV